MHDTLQQGLFNKLMRFESSGCVRVQNVRDLTTRQNNPIKIAQEVPVYFVYITAWSAKDRIVQFRDDIYQRDGDVELALNTTTSIDQPAEAAGIEGDMLPRR